MNNVSVVEDLLTLNILLYDADILDENILGELARRSVQKYENSVQLLSYNNYLCFVSNNNAVFQSFCCPERDTFLTRTFNWKKIQPVVVNEFKMSISGTYIKWKHRETL